MGRGVGQRPRRHLPYRLVLAQGDPGGRNMKTRVVGDISALDKHGSGAQLVTWWGTLGFMSLEGMGFVLAAGSFLFFCGATSTWSQSGAPQGLLWPQIFTGFLGLSVNPNFILTKLTQGHD